MPPQIQTGSLDKAGHPVVKIRVYGIIAENKVEFDAMIDTGFSGFLMMPLMDALPLALTLFGTSAFTLADGSTQQKLLAFGSIEVGEETVKGVIALEPNSTGLLLGVDFLRKANKAFILENSGWTLIDQGAAGFGIATRRIF